MLTKTLDAVKGIVKKAFFIADDSSDKKISLLAILRLALLALCTMIFTWIYLF